jgi:hypothetical protein
MYQRTVNAKVGDEFTPAQAGEIDGKNHVTRTEMLDVAQMDFLT